MTHCCGDLNFDSTINNTYRIHLTSGGQTLTAFAQIGTGAGAAVAAVPEPATWAMMLLGFGAMACRCAVGVARTACCRLRN